MEDNKISAYTTSEVERRMVDAQTTLEGLLAEVEERRVRLVHPLSFAIGRAIVDDWNNDEFYETLDYLRTEYSYTTKGLAGGVPVEMSMEDWINFLD